MKMKRFVMVTIVFCLLSMTAAIFATESEQLTYLYIDTILDTSKKLTDEQIQRISILSTDLTATQRTLLYESHRKENVGIPIALNTLVGFGMGSFAQGDIGTGWLLLGLDVAASTLLGYGYGLIQADDVKSGTLCLAVGALPLLFSKIAGVVFPSSFAKKYNMNLSSALISVSMVPVVDQSTHVGMRLAANIRF